MSEKYIQFKQDIQGLLDLHGCSPQYAQLISFLDLLNAKDDGSFWERVSSIRVERFTHSNAWGISLVWRRLKGPWAELVIPFDCRGDEVKNMSVRVEVRKEIWSRPSLWIPEDIQTLDFLVETLFWGFKVIRGAKLEFED